MDLMRSEAMTFVQLIIPAESAHRAITYLGELGLLQFRDVTSLSLSQIPTFVPFFELRFVCGNVFVDVSFGVCGVCSNRVREGFAFAALFELSCRRV